MLERVIENWLDKASEKSFQRPFCYMLSAQGHTIIHVTRHCGMELGKDIITIDSGGIPCAFQLKTGKISLSKWKNEVSQQVDDLVVGRINHPSVDSAKHHRSYLVTNGTIDEEVSHAIDARNQTWQKQGQPYLHLETIVRGQLLERAKSLGTDLWPSELTEIKTFLELFLENGQGILPKEKLALLFESTFPLKPLNNDKKLSARHSRRVITSAAMLCAIAISSFSNKNNYAAEIEAWMLYIAYVLALAERWKLPFRRYEDSFEIAKESIYNSLANLCDEIKRRKHLVEGNPLTDPYIYSVRVTWLLALMSIFALWRRNDGLPNEDVDDLLREFCQEKWGQSYIFGEAAIPQVLAFMWYFRKMNPTKTPDDLLRALISSICKRNGPKGERPFASPYYEAEEILPHILNIAEEPLTDSFTGESYSIEGLVHLYVRRNWKQSMKLLWPRITRLGNVSFEPESLWDFYRWRNEQGTHKIVYPKYTQEWDELKALSFESAGPNIPPTIKNQPILLLLFLCVYPHRMNAEVLRWLDTEMEQIKMP